MNTKRCSAATQRAKFSFIRMDFLGLVFRKDGRCRESVLNPVRFVVDVFLTGYFEEWPIFGTDSYYFSGSKAFRYKVGLKTDLDATASEWNSFVSF